MAGETDLAKLLGSLRVEQRDDPFTVVTRPGPVEPSPSPGATIEEREGTTVVLTVAEAQRRGWPVDFVAAWLTLGVHSALEAVGLTAAVSAALSTREIPCNVLAGFHHDHILVPWDRAAEAVDVIAALATSPPGSR